MNTTISKQKLTRSKAKTKAFGAAYGMNQNISDASFKPYHATFMKNAHCCVCKEYKLCTKIDVCGNLYKVCSRQCREMIELTPLIYRHIKRSGNSGKWALVRMKKNSA